MDRLEHLTLDITYDMNSEEFSIKSDAKKEAYADLISAFLRLQMGAGEDKSKANEQDVYHITIKWQPHNDVFEASSDTGNKGLREGILLDILDKLRKQT